MPISLVILEGPTPATARPILATHDPAIIAAVRNLLLDRLAEHPGRILPLKQRRQLRKRQPEEGLSD